jgi:hypothetical protein
MTLIMTHRHIILVLLLLVTKFGYSVYSDTTIVTRWRDNQKKVVTIYKIKRTQIKDGKTITVLKRKKEEKFYRPACDDVFDEEWHEVDKCEVSKTDFDRFYSEYNKLDSLNEIKRKISKRKIIRKNVIVVRLGYENSRLNFPMNINIGDTNIYTYKKHDTIIGGNTYPYQVFMKDTLSPSQYFKFSAALRTDTFKIYSFDPNTQSEILKADIEAMGKEAGINILSATGATIEATYNTVSTISKDVKKSATKGLALILANLILMQK